MSSVQVVDLGHNVGAVQQVGQQCTAAPVATPVSVGGSTTAAPTVTAAPTSQWHDGLPRRRAARGDALRPFRRDRPGRDGRQPRGERFRGAQGARAALRSAAGGEGERVGGPAGQGRGGGRASAGRPALMDALAAPSRRPRRSWPWWARRPIGRSAELSKVERRRLRRPSSGSTCRSAARWASARPK